jgi:hemerythrin-like metal-binding protein
MINSLRYKLIFFSITSILLSLIIAGFFIDNLLSSLYGDKAIHDAEHAYEMIYDDVKDIESNMANQSLDISLNPTVVAAVNLVNRYQDIKNYQPLVFDKEKKKLANRILQNLDVFYRVKVAVYNKNGELIVFSTKHGLEKTSGITTYNKSGVKYISKSMDSKIWQSQALPSLIEPYIKLPSDWESFVSRSGKVEYLSNEHTFTIETFRTIQRDHPDGVSESIGFIKMMVVFDDHFVKELSGVSHTNVSLVLANNRVLNKPNEFDSLYDLNNSSNLFGSAQLSSAKWLEHEVYYMHSYVLPVVNGRIFFLISQPKSDLDFALNKSRYALFLIFIFTASIALPFGIYWRNTRVSKPLNKLTGQLERVEKNEYPRFYESSSKDEISRLGNGLNKMVKVIKSREKDLKSSQYDLNEAQHLAKIGSWKLDFVNNKLEWSDEVFNIFGRDAETFDPSYETFLQTIHPDDRERVNRAYTSSLINKKPYNITHRLLMKDDSIKYIQEHCESVFDEEGKPLTSKGTVQDITEKQLKDEIVSRTQKMDALGKLTGGIAHDFNNMLGVILGYSELLQSTLNKDDNNLKYINEILVAGDRARVLTKKLLAFSRKEATTAEPVDINELLLGEKNLLEKTLTARIELVYDFEEDLWPVMLDKSDIQNAVLNLSINAMHAIPDTGSLIIKTSNVHLEESDIKNLDLDFGDYVLLSITDTGIGMDEDVLSKLFDPFFTTKGEKGTGLGMSQVYGFVQKTGGAIHVYSQLGHGTRMAIYLPRCSDSESRLVVNEHDNDEQIEHGNETILVVDDEVALRELATEILSKHNYRVLCAGNGIEALKVLETESVDLILSDVIMPVMNGYQLAEKVRELYPDIKIQMASGFADDRHTNMGAITQNLHQQRLQKPFTSKMLLRKIRQHLDEHKGSADQSSSGEVCTDKASASIQWSDTYSSGLGVIDADHKKLIELINRCGKAINDNQQDEIILSILDELVTYLNYHFQREELVMETCEYPDIDKHKIKHIELSKQVEERISEYGNGKLSAQLLLDFLINWLKTHILGEDLTIVEYCNNNDLKIEQAFKKAGYVYQANNAD